VTDALAALDDAVAAWRRTRGGARAAAVAAWLSRYAAEYERLKRERGVVDFRDLALATRDLLRDRPEARRRAAARWDAVLLDEAQDTDPLQMEIAILLSAHDSVPADPFDAALAPGRLFLVGDPKQSIYRFRRADLELYARTRRAVTANGESATIQASFRSHPSILRFVNRVFAGWMVAGEDAPWQAAYVDLVPGLAPAGDGGAAADDGAPRVSLLLPDPRRRDELLRRAGRAALRAEERTELEIDAVVRGVRRVLGRDGAAEAWRVVGPDAHAERPVRPADVGVLCRHNAWGDRLLDALRRAGIPATSTAGRGFHAREEIMTLAILLQAILRPDDPTALFAALRSPALALSDDDLVLRFLDGGGDAAPPATSAALLDAEARLRALSEPARSLAPADFLERLAEDLALFPAFAFRPDGAARVENLRLVIEAAAPLAEAGFDSLPDFARWLAERGADDPLTLGEIEPPGGDVVSILTIHKAKGLEFPVVFVADLGAQPRSSMPCVADRARGTLEFRLGPDVASPAFEEASRREKLRRSAEDLRLLYVAATRARDRLVLSWPEGDRGFLAPDMLPRRLGARPGEPPPAGGDVDAWPAETLPPLGETASVHVVDVEGAIRASIAAAGTGELFAPAAEEPAPRRGRILRVTSLADADLGPPADDSLPLREDEDPAAPSGRAFGTFVHAALEAWDPLLPFDEALARAVAAGDPPQARDARARFEAELRRIARDPAVRAILDALRAGDRAVRREVPFLVPLGDDFLSGKVDVIRERADGTLAILDYKTERLRPEDAAARAARHRRQAALYAWAVGRLARRPVAEVRLLFLATTPVTASTFAGDEGLLRLARSTLEDADLLRRAHGRADRDDDATPARFGAA
jgi:ATP-dependent helicase/nuclease subunit A